MIDFRLVITADGAGCIKEHRQHVFLDIGYLRRVLQEALHHVLQVTEIELQELAFHQLLGVFGDPATWIVSALESHRLKDEVKEAVYRLHVTGINGQEAVILDVLFDDLCVSPHLIHRIELSAWR